MYYRVAQRLGLSLNVVNVFGRMGAHLEAPIQVVPLDMEHEPTTDDLYEIMCRGSHVSLDEVKRHPHGHVFEELLEQRVGPSDPDCEDRLDVGNADMLAELGEIRDRVCTAEVDDDRPFLFVPRRENRVINSTGRTLPGLMRGPPLQPRLHAPRRPLPPRHRGRATSWRSAPSTTPSRASPRPTPTCAAGWCR